MNVGHGYRVFDGVIANFIGLAIAHAATDAAAGHPHQETMGIVVATAVAL